MREGEKGWRLAAGGWRLAERNNAPHDPERDARGTPASRWSTCRKLSRRVDLPVITVHRRPPADGDLIRALETAGFADRIPLLGRAGPSHPLGRIHFTCAGTSPDEARPLLLAEAGRSHLPEGLRLAHLIAQGLVLGESRGRRSRNLEVGSRKLLTTGRAPSRWLEEGP